MHIRTLSSFCFRDQELWGGAQDKCSFFFILQVILMLPEFEIYCCVNQKSANYVPGARSGLLPDIAQLMSRQWFTYL